MAAMSSTIFSRSTSTITSHIAHFRAKFFDANRHSLIFTVSPPSSNDDLASIVNSLNNISEQSVGCISASERSLDGRDIISCSISLVDKANTTIFRSTIPGKAKTQVGRWHAFALKDMDEMRLEDRNLNDLSSPNEAGDRQAGSSSSSVDWEEVWGRTVPQEGSKNELPEDLRDLRPDSVRHVVYLSDSSPEGLLSTLRHRFPSSSQLGLLASSTPFITGRPVTLFHNGRVYEDGAVGIAFSLPTSPLLDLQFPEDLKPLGREMVVTRAQGNLINTLDGANPTKLLLRAIQDAGIDASSDAAALFKEEEEFYLAVGKEMPQIYRITSGDTSRGTIALNTTRAPAVGSIVQFYNRSKRTNEPPYTFRSTASPSMTFRVAELEEYVASLGEDPIILDKTFHVASENGLVVSRHGGEMPWRCIVPGCMASLRI